MFVAIPSQPDALQQQIGLLEGEETLLASFLRSVSHDLRSPLLTLALSAELLSDTSPADEREQVAREAITHGLQDMERMLDAVTGVSRARRRILVDGPVPLATVLDGVRVTGDAPLPGAALTIDARAVGEALRTLGRDVEVRLETQPESVVVSVALPEAIAGTEGSCVAALLGDLHVYAGTEVAALAVAEVVLARQGATLRCEDGCVRLWLPLADGRTE